MPTEAERGDPDFDPLNNTLTDFYTSWTDDLPVCSRSGVGSSTNQVYRADGVRKEEHEYEDRSFHFCLDEDTSFYGVFDGQYGCKAVEFASQRMPAEILLGQLKDKKMDQEIKDVLQQAFLTVETCFFQSIDNLLAEKENLRLHLQGIQTYEALKQYPNVVQRLNCVTAEIESGAAAVVALIHKNKLYIANVGNSRAILCRKDELGNDRIYQLTVDHDFENEDELLRLSQLGLNDDIFHQRAKTSRHQSTRCIGNYVVKGGYKEFDILSEATEEPVLAEPEVVGGIELDETCKFLFLMSGGLYKSLEQATGTKDANSMIMEMLVEQFGEQSTLNGVAQAVVDKAARIHHDAFMKNNEASKNCLKRDDITVLVRNFNQPLPNADRSPPEICKTLPHKQVADSYDGEQSSNVNTLADIASIDNSYDCSEGSLDNRDSISSSSECVPQLLFHPSHSMNLDDEGKIRPYVDFTEFYDLVEEAYQENLVPSDWRRQSTNDG